MSFFKTVYDTTLGSIIDTKIIENKIVESFIKDDLHKQNIDVDNSLMIKPVYITGYSDSEVDIPLFTHSIIVNYKGTDYLCTDIRLYINTKEYKESKNLQSSIRNKTEYNFIRSKSIIELAWVNGNTSYMKDSLKFAASVYSVNVSEAIARAYALDASDRVRLNVLGIAYYRSLFLEKDELSYDAQESALVHSIKALGVSEKFYRETMANVGNLRNTNDFIDAIKVSLENNRLNNLNLVVLLTLLKNSWYGNNAKDYISGSLEHPPTWMAIVYTALNEKTYKSSLVYKIIEKLKRGNNIETFNKSYEELVQRHLLGPSVESMMDELELDLIKCQVTD